MMRVRLKTATLARALARKNMSQNNFARRSGISRSYLSQLIRGQRCPSARTRRRILEELGEQGFDDLFEEVEDDE